MIIATDHHSRPQNKERDAFLRQLLLHAVQFGITTTLLPIALELGAALLVDAGKVWQNFKSNWPFEVLILAVFFLAGALVGSIRFTLSRLPHSHRDVMKRWTPDAIATLIASRSNPGYKTGIEATSDGVGFTLHPCRPLVMFLQALGLVEASQDGFRAVSQAADSFLVSLTAHLRGGNPTFMGDWRSGSNEAQSRRLTAMVGGFESHRIDTAPGGNAHPARNTRAGIALVRADVNAIPHFLVIKSHTWTPEGAWTPVMGGEERIDDGDLLNTVTREVCEEMKLRPDDILDTRELARTNDRRISKRLGLDTQYEFGIFSVQLRQASPAVRAFLTDNPRVVIDYNKAVRTHEFTWLTWAELLAQAHLRAEMPTVIQALEQLPFSDISQSIAIPEFEKTVAESRSAPA